MNSNKTVAILNAAAAGAYGVLAAIAYNVEHVTALVRAAEQKRSPLILLLFPSTVKQLPSLVFAASAAARSASVPISLHLDHAQDEAQIHQVVDSLPFDSIMVDMSHYDRNENLYKTKQLAALCHAKRIAVEGESGRINGGEDGIMDTGTLKALFTSLSDVDDFIDAGVDLLAPSIGNIHGDYRAQGPQLNLVKLREIHKHINNRAGLVLHGTNDFSPELMKECIKAGVTKINVNKLLLEIWNVFLKQNAARLPLTELMDHGMEVLQMEVGRWMDIVGSSDRA